MLQRMRLLLALGLLVLALLLAAQPQAHWGCGEHRDRAGAQLLALILPEVLGWEVPQTLRRQKVHQRWSAQAIARSNAAWQAHQG